MASPIEKAGNTSKQDEEKKDYDEELDFFSAKFNPERALFSENISVPYPEIKSFPTVFKYENAVQKRKQRKQQSQTELAGKDESTSTERSLRADSKNKPPNRSKSPESRHSSIIDSRQQHSHKSGDKTTFQSGPRPSTGSVLSDDHRHMSEFSKSRSSRYEKELTHRNFKKRNQLRQLMDIKISSRHLLEVPESDLKDSRSKLDQNKSAEKCKPSRDGNFTNSKPEKSRELSSVVLSDHGVGTSHSGSRSGNKTKQRNVFSRMEAISGPISLLKRCVEERLHVRVKTRAAVSVRSICRGYIVAFDKYFNMAMIDVDEIYKRPAALGKVRVRRTHKLIAAQKTLIKEKEESLARWRSLQESKNKDISSASSSFQALNIVPSVDELNKILTNVSKQKDILCSPGESLTSGARTSDLSCEASNNKTGVLSEKDKLLERQLRRIQSVYEGVKTPLSPFEREALMLGVPDENITIRHINQLLIRGENVVSVSIIDDL